MTLFSLSNCQWFRGWDKVERSVSQKCENGYALNLEAKCVDIDECITKSHNCRNGETCMNTKGSFKCAVTERDHFGRFFGPSVSGIVLLKNNIVLIKL
ncbi:fibulin-2-like protein [Leptotrombidium deliense]|uniref:Fibulin-2-like protein n=1 Tax=Leptotrombidium deliense TaxID=299467 RepID=A0A443RVY3_9ACAR|nr:fibulin-2-like protein [Leptotrombidium deliense]